jgi:Carboxypeptidase regulatory-like domain
MSLIRYTRCVLFLVSLSLLLCGVVPGQTFRGGISGSVTDSSDAVVPNAAVHLRNTGTNVMQDTISSSAGQFEFPDLPLGTYEVSVKATGFQDVVVTGINISAGGIYSLPVKLHIAQSTQSVEISAASISLDTVSITEDSVLPTRAVQDIPLNGRDFTQLIALTPGFTGYGASGGIEGSSINGLHENQVNWQIDGADNNDFNGNYPALNQGGLGGIAGLVMPVDAIDQFSMVTSSESETGRSPAGTSNISIKSGTNQIHGTAYYYNRNEMFAKQTPFATPGQEKRKIRADETGGSLGGPIRKDHDFLFAAFEFQTNEIGNQTHSTEPSTAYQTEALSVMSYYGIAENPLSQNMLANLWPASSLTGPATLNNYYDPALQTGYSYNGLLKVDHNFNKNNHLSVRADGHSGAQFGPVGSYLQPYYEIDDHHVYNGAIIFNSVLSSRLVNQLLAGYNEFNGYFDDEVTAWNPIANGFNDGVTNPALFGAPGIKMTNFDSIGVTTQSGRSDITGHIVDTVSYTVGKHQMRFGGEYRAAQEDTFSQSGQRGTFTFAGTQGPWYYPTNHVTTKCDSLATRNMGTSAPGYAPGSSYDADVLYLADFMAGCVSTSSIVEGNPKRQIFANDYYLFAQDMYQVSQRLNVNLGLRDEYTGPIYSDYPNMSEFDPYVPGGLAVVGQQVKGLYNRFYGGISPRAGFSWQPPKTKGTVLRGGMGVYFDTPPAAFFIGGKASDGGPIGFQSNPVGSNISATVSEAAYILTPNQQMFPPLATALAGQTVFGVSAIQRSFHSSYTYNYNLNIQQALGPNVLLQVGYQGTNVHRIPVILDLNQAALNSAFVPATCAATYASAYLGNQQCSRPFFSQFPGLGTINQLSGEGVSNYNGLQVILKASNWHGLVTQISYAWSHALDDAVGGLGVGEPQDSTNLLGNYGNGDYDQRHVLNGFVAYSIPAIPHVPGFLTHGWRVNSLVTFQTGVPFTVTASSNSSGNGESADRAIQIAGTNPFAGLTHQVVNGSVTWFNKADFSNPPEGTYGNQGRNQYRNPGYGDMDLSVYKDSHIRDGLTLQIRAEFYNFFNRINLAPTSSTDTGGVISSTIGASKAAPGIGPGEPFNTDLVAKFIF